MSRMFSTSKQIFQSAPEGITQVFMGFFFTSIKIPKEMVTNYENPEMVENMALSIIPILHPSLICNPDLKEEQRGVT